MIICKELWKKVKKISTKIFHTFSWLFFKDVEHLRILVRFMKKINENNFFRWSVFKRILFCISNTWFITNEDEVNNSIIFQSSVSESKCFCKSMINPYIIFVELLLYLFMKNKCHVEHKFYWVKIFIFEAKYRVWNIFKFSLKTKSIYCIFQHLRIFVLHESTTDIITAKSN